MGDMDLLMGLTASKKVVIRRPLSYMLGRQASLRRPRRRPDAEE